MILLSALLAGCITAPDDVDEIDETLKGLLAGPAIWDDPQNAPHAAYGWPTLSFPPEGDDIPDWWRPIDGAPLPDLVSGLELIAETPEEVQSGAGIAVFGRLVFVPGFSSESYLVDITDPTAPQHLSTIEAGEGAHRGAAFIAYPDGRLVVVVSTGPGFDIIDVTDPLDPDVLTRVQPEQRGHKLGVVPGTPIVYNAASRGGHIVEEMADRGTEIYDLSDPENPEFVQMFENGYSCHHIYFWNNPPEDKYRAVCAGAEVTQIWDTKDPLDPQVIVSVPVHHGIAGLPAASVTPVLWSHYAGLSQDGNTLIVGDETFIGSGSCGVGVPTPAGHLSTPLGAVWFYDISDETNPIIKGWFNPGHELPEPYNLCTAHQARLIPSQDRDLLAMAFYEAGVVLVDFTDPSQIHMVDQFNQGTNTWEVWYYDGYLVTGDLARGMDVLRLS
jgi:hypothetical protein